MFQEGLAFVQDQQYRVTFDAMSTVDREINVKLIAADNTEYVATIALTSTMTTYTADFTFAAASQGGKLDFELGGAQNGITVSAASVVTFDNVKVENFDGTAVVADTDQIEDGVFENTNNLMGWTSWSRDWAPVITSSLAEEWNELVFRYDGVGDATWNNQISYEGLTFEHGATYRLVFKAKGDAARDFKVNIYDGSNGLESEDFALTTEFQTFEHVFTYNLGATAKVEFQLGAFTTSDGSVFYLDDVVIEKLVQDDVVMNGEFNESGWMTWMANWNSTSATFTDNTGALVLDIADVGAENWNIQLFQENLDFVQDNQYRVSFDAMSTVARDINLKIIAADGTEYTQNVSLTTSMATYTFDFTFLVASQAGKVDFELGGAQNGITVSVPSVVTIDNVMVEDFDGTAVVADTNQVVNSTVDQPLDWYNWIDPEGWSGAATEAYITVVDGVVVIDIVQAGGAGWAIQFVQDIMLKEGLTYIVEFDAYAVAGRTINAVVGFDNGSWNLMGGNEAMTITDTVATYSFSFVATDPGEAQVVLKLEAGGDLNNVYIDNVIIYPDYN